MHLNTPGAHLDLDKTIGFGALSLKTMGCRRGLTNGKDAPTPKISKVIGIQSAKRISVERDPFFSAPDV